MKPLYSIQYLRAFAALSVVAFHTGLAGRVGQAGVDIFFVISGLIMWIVTERENKPGSFFLRRIARVWPLYVIATIAMALHIRPDLIDTVKSMLFVPYRNGDGHIWPVLVQGWTLNYEMFFYFLVACALIVSRESMPILLSMVLISLSIIGLTTKPHNAVLATFTSPILLEFLSGIWIGSLLTKKWILAPGAGVVLIALALVIFLASNFIITLDQYRFLVWGVPSIMLVCGALSLEVAGLVPVLKPAVTLGNSSYSIYLFHPFLQKTTLRLLNVLPPFVSLVGVLIANVILGITIYSVVEKRLSRLGKKIVNSVERHFSRAEAKLRFR